MKLTELKIKNLKPQKTRYYVSDGGGLYLAVMPTGEKYWYRRSWNNNKERKWSLGHWPEVSLKQARELNYTMKHPARDTSVPLSKVAQDWWDARCAPVLAPATLRSKRYHLDKHILPRLGGRDMNTLTPQDVISFVRDVQASTSVFVGHTSKSVLSQIFQYAIAAGLCEWNPVKQITGALTPPPPSQHWSTIQTEAQAREILQAVHGYAGNKAVRLALLLLAYTFVRPSEMRGARWVEIDFDKAEWRIPPERMKMKREHTVPLSTQALALFKELKDLTRHPVYCFVLPASKNPFSLSMLTTAFRRMGYGKGKMTPHGFRGMASTLLNEHGFPPDIIERQLAHAELNAVRAAYNRAEYMDERRKMMQWWGDFIDSLLVPALP